MLPSIVVEAPPWLEVFPVSFRVFTDDRGKAGLQFGFGPCRFDLGAFGQNAAVALEDRRRSGAGESHQGSRNYGHQTQDLDVLHDLLLHRPEAAS